MKRRQLLQGAAAVALSGMALAQDKYPSKTILWICPYAAGGNADNRSRQVARVMGTLLGQTIIIENKAGAGGNIGTEAIARAKPDGYTLGMGNFAPMAVNPTLYTAQELAKRVNQRVKSLDSRLMTASVSGCFSMAARIVAAISSPVMTVPDACCSPAARPSVSAMIVSMRRL